MADMITLFGSSVGKEEVGAVARTFEKQWVGIGKETTEFEKQIASKTGIPSFVFLNSGSNALQLAVRLLNLPEGSEVILPSFTWIACANAIKLNRLVPVFCDVDLDTANVTRETVEAKITKKTKAVMVVHYAGKPVDMDPIMDLDLPVIEDAAHAVDSYYKGKHCGAIGSLGIFSFDAVKNITTGEGGGLLSQDTSKLDYARKLRYCGIAKSGFESTTTKNRWWEYEIHDFFPKMLNTDMAAAMGIEQLKKLDQFQSRRKEIWNQYSKCFRTESWANTWLDIPAEAESHEKHSYFTYLIRLKKGNRDELAHFLFEKKIYTSLRYHPLHLNAIYGSSDRLPVSEKLNETGLNIPLHQRMTNDDVSRILSALKEFRESKV